MSHNDVYYMNKALDNAKLAYSKDDVPVGCVIVYKGEIIASAYNRKNLENIATYHAEILAIEEACRNLNSWYLDECILYTTVEPCMMCTGAIIQSRIKKIVYGTRNEAFGYLSKLDNPKIDITAGVMKEECTQILSNFFKKKRVTTNC